MTMTRYPARPLAVALATAWLAAGGAFAHPAADKAGTPAPAAAAGAPAAMPSPGTTPTAAPAPTTAKDGPVELAPAAKDAKGKSGETVAEEPVPEGPLGPLAWLNGCWKGAVGAGARVREFREYWHPLRGNLMVGVGHNALANQTVSYEYLRLEPRGSDVYYVATPADRPAVAFKLSETRREGKDDLFTFRTAGSGFPTAITYRRGTLGWLYVEVAGRVNDKGAERDHKVTYPFRRVDCESGEFIKK